MASVTTPLVTCAPENVIVIPCDGFQVGNATLTFAAQGGYQNTTLIVPGTIAANPDYLTGTSGAQAFTFTVPDGLTDDTGVLADLATTPNTAALSVRVVTQYVFADEYMASGEGVDLSSLNPGDLDAILRRASASADQYMGKDIRYLQVVERHKFRNNRRNSAPRVFPYRTKGRAANCPILSVDSLKFVTSQNLVTTFGSQDVYVNADSGYVEMLAYAFGNLALLGVIETIGYSANVIEIEYTSGFTVAKYPSQVREAVTMIASSLLGRRFIQMLGMPGFVSMDGLNKSLVLDPKNPEAGANYAIPKEAKQLLSSYCTYGLA